MLDALYNGFVIGKTRLIFDWEVTCRVSVAAGVTTDLAGNPNTAATYTYAFQPANPSYTTVSTVANAVTGASLGVAVAAPLALGALSTGPHHPSLRPLTSVPLGLYQET